MPARSQARIRRDINRLKDVVDRNLSSQPALHAIKAPVDTAAALVNERWRAYQKAAVAADKERDERDSALDVARKWVQRWRPVVLLTVPGADQNTRALPPSGATPDDMIQVADDLYHFIKSNPGTAAFRMAALGEIGDGIDRARAEASEASAALPNETATRAAFGEAVIAANTVLVRGSEVVRAIFGPTSPEYKQFIARDANDTDDDAGSDSNADDDSASTPTASVPPAP